MECDPCSKVNHQSIFRVTSDRAKSTSCHQKWSRWIRSSKLIGHSMFDKFPELSTKKLFLFKNCKMFNPSIHLPSHKWIDQKFNQQVSIHCHWTVIQSGSVVLNFEKLSQEPKEVIKVVQTCFQSLKCCCCSRTVKCVYSASKSKFWSKIVHKSCSN